jgi:hypothetical protein
MAIKLPEKNYFTRDEIAQGWGCERDLVDHYIEHGSLREALVLSKESFSEVRRFKYLKCDLRSKVFYNYTNFWRRDYEDLTDLLAESETEIDAQSIVKCPKFAYVLNEKQMFIYEDCPTTIPTFDGFETRYIAGTEKRPRLAFIAGLENERYIPTSLAARGKYKRKPNTHTRYFVDLFLSEKALSNRFIPREERDRFEAINDADNNETLATAIPASMREAKNRQRLIAMMLQLLTDKDRRFNSQAALVTYLTTEAPKVDGLGKRTLESIFADAKKVLNDEK